MRRASSWPLYVLLLAAVSCGGGDGVTEPGPGGEPASITIVSGDDQTGTVGAELPNPLVVQIKTAQGDPVGGQAVNFHVVAGGGTVFAGTATTNSQGIAQERWTLGTVAGADQRVEVRVINATTGAALPTQIFRATAAAGAAKTIDKAGGDNTQAVVGTAVSDRPRVRALDQYGNPVPGVAVTFAVISGNGTISGGTQTTDAGGYATVGAWTLGTTSGANTLTATASGLTGSPLTFTSTGTSSAATQITARPASTTGRVGARVEVEPSVLVRDAYGNPVQGVRVHYAITQGAGSITRTDSETGAGGTAGVAWTLDTIAGTNKLTATVAGLAGSPVTFTATGVAGPPEHLGVGTLPSASVPNRVVFPRQPVIEVRDRYNNVVSQGGWSVSVTIAPGGSGGTLGGTTTVTTSTSGKATFTDLYIAGTVGQRTLRFNTTGLSGNQAPVTITTGEATTITAAGGSSIAQILTTLVTPPSVKVADADGNGVSGVTVTFAVASGGGTITGPTQTTNSSGIATVGSWTLGATDGTNTLTASAPGLSSVTITATAVRFSSVAAGDFHTCGVTTAGVTYCWGAVPLASGDVSADSPMRIDTEVKFVSLTAGSDHSCGLTASGTAYCWGGNAYGQLGDGTTARKSVPVGVSGGLSFKRLDAGALHTCGVTTGGAAYCWGRNRWLEPGSSSTYREGFLGDGTTTDRAAPVAVAGGLTFRSVSAGVYHTCGVTTGNTAYCWGANRYGQLGTTAVSYGILPGYQNSTSPVAVEGGLSFESVFASSPSASTTSHSCATTTAGKAYCWGSGGYGQLGNGSSGSNEPNPVAVVGGHAFNTLSSGYEHTCGATSAKVYCWGNLIVASGTVAETPTPTAVNGAAAFDAVTAGHYFTCGIASDGRTYCWGSNAWGQLGNAPAPGTGSGDTTTPVLVRWR